MSLNFDLVRQTCECGKTETFHLGKSSAGSQFTFHAEKTWPLENRYTLWTNKVIAWLELGGHIEDEYGCKFSYLELLERIKEDSAHKQRVAIEYDSAGRAWLTGEFC